MIGGDGRDNLVGGLGDDTLSGGLGNDRIDGGPGRNSVNAGAGNDFVDAANGEIDTVSCSTGTGDRVIADAGDRVSQCESVLRLRR